MAFAAFGVLFVLVGVGACVGAVVMAVSKSRATATWSTGTGTVVRLVPSGRMFAPVVAFPTPRGTVEVQSAIASSPPAHRVGEAVQVRFDPADPSKAEIDSFFVRWFGPGVLGFLGIVFGFMGVVFTLVALLAPPP